MPRRPAAIPPPAERRPVSTPAGSYTITIPDWRPTEKLIRSGAIHVDDDAMGEYNDTSRARCIRPRPTLTTAHLVGARHAMAENQSTRRRIPVKRDVARDRVYRIWASMIQRCVNPNSSGFHRYGGRGVRVCERWRNSFLAFEADMGPRPTPSHSVDRIDNDGDYEPSNCRWASVREQSSNKSTNKLLTYRGRTMSVTEWASELGVSRDLIQRRLRLGWSVADAFERPSRRSGVSWAINRPSGFPKLTRHAVVVIRNMDEISARMGAGETHECIASSLGMSQSSFTRWVNVLTNRMDDYRNLMDGLGEAGVERLLSGESRSRWSEHPRRFKADGVTQE